MASASLVMDNSRQLLTSSFLLGFSLCASRALIVSSQFGQVGFAQEHPRPEQAATTLPRERDGRPGHPQERTPSNAPTF